MVTENSVISKQFPKLMDISEKGICTQILAKKLYGDSAHPLKVSHAPEISLTFLGLSIFS
jgi:hypothetical protein